MKYELNVLKVMSLLSPALKVMAHVCNMFTVLHFESLVARLLISCCAMVIWYTLMHGNDPSAWITWYIKTDIKEESRGWFFPYSFAMGIQKQPACENSNVHYSLSIICKPIKSYFCKIVCTQNFVHKQWKIYKCCCCCMWKYKHGQTSI